ncbi:hypothetical protein HPB47_013077 [Ixodes persulcatus]|uniref:Uncharacterized protein n=1 Tax=Ixodes persulcatus TaxID=34615 RepID=A0AC60NRS6_IXOPE|nr:hypothetical protein HPB47_013077 [Ixodes persulcatus]
MICTDIWDEAEALAKLRSLIFPSGQLDVEAYHVSPRDEGSRGVIHGVRPELSNAQIKEKTKAPGHEILDARRLGRSKSAVVTFAGTKVLFTVMFNWLETHCFLYKKTKAACLNCGEAGHRTDVCSKPTGYACAICGTAQAMEGHPCVPKFALCGGAHKTYDSHCPEKFFKEKIQTERTGRSRSRHRNGEQLVRWRSKEQSGSRHSGAFSDLPRLDQPLFTATASTTATSIPAANLNCQKTDRFFSGHGSSNNDSMVHMPCSCISQAFLALLLLWSSPCTNASASYPALFLQSPDCGGYQCSVSGAFSDLPRLDQLLFTATASTTATSIPAANLNCQKTDRFFSGHGSSNNDSMAHMPCSCISQQISKLQEKLVTPGASCRKEKEEEKP